MTTYARQPIDGPWRYRFDLNPDMAEAADALAHAREDSMPDKKEADHFLPGFPLWYRNRIGARGEYAYSAFSGLPVDVHTIGRGDGGVDFPNGVQVKTVWSRPDRPPLKTPFLFIDPDRWAGKSDKAACFVLAYVSGTFNTVHLMGSVAREDIEARFRGPRVFAKGKRPSWYVRHQDLDLWLPLPAPARGTP